AAANKRVSNILAKNPADLPAQINTDLLVESQEQELYKLVAAKQTELAPVFAQRQYSQALAALATLREAVDAFFDSVMVMAEDEQTKLNRLLLLSQLRALFLQVADISVLQK
ncbi:glycyl-tRNA ligase subunit beta, partial [Catenovulum agarivorans DS-2]